MTTLVRVTRDLGTNLTALLRSIGGAGQAEEESSDRFRAGFMPIPEHVRAFDPGVVLVVGDRGAGKSALLRAVFRENLMDAIRRHCPRARLPLADQSSWKTAFPLDRDFPNYRNLRTFLKESDEPRRAMEDLWFAYLLRVLREDVDIGAGGALAQIMDAEGGDAAAVVSAFRRLDGKETLPLDALDRELEKVDRWLFVAYDELDTVGGPDSGLTEHAIRGLVAFWAQTARRWRRLRPKIFLRTDYFERNATVGGPDLAKLAANRAELSWSDRHLYAVLVKRLVNASDEFRNYCTDEQGRVRLHSEGKSDPLIGWVPVIEDAEAARPLIERMVGEYMGADRRKGQSFRWLLDHVRDGHGRAVPRSLLLLVETAAREELKSPAAQRTRLLAPSSLRRALDEVSLFHVTQAISSEWPWLHGLKDRLQGLPPVPVPRRDVETRLGQQWDDTWGIGDEVRPPADNSRELVDYVLRLGILRERPGERLDAPDLYLAGLGLRRRGGSSRG